MKYFNLFLSLFLTTSLLSQIEATNGASRLKEFDKRMEMVSSSELKGIQFRSVGPTVMSGRVVDIAVDPKDPTHFFVAYASGGLWETKNNGHSFIPLFDEESVMTIGAIAVNWNDTSLWIGTGEVNSSRSSYSGVGVYYSSDKGKTWDNKGLADSQHIGSIIVHPEDGNIVYVASLGPLYSAGGQKGVFKTTTGGDTWYQTLDMGVGAVDMVIHPTNPDILYASVWDRHRDAWNFQGNGAKSGIYKSSDGGENWTSISKENSGFPQGDGVGRIGLTVTVEGESTHLYAIHDNQARRPKEFGEEEEQLSNLKKGAFKEMTKAEFLALKKSEVEEFLGSNNFPEKYSYSYIKKRIEDEELEPSALYDYLSDANTDLFDTPVIGAEVYCYDDSNGGWSKTHEGYLDDLVYSYGYYFGLIQVQPGDKDKIYIGGVPLLYSEDGGKNWKNINPENVHADHHVVWLNPDRPGHIINGNDGGINISYDNGEHYLNCNSPAVGQFYTVQVDNADPYNIYGGLQDNGVWKGPSYYEASSSWYQSGKYPYEMLMGGDGMQIEVDPRDNETIYTGYQFGHYYRIKEGEKPLYFHPSHELGEKPLRWNWQTPIELSSHNPDILYMASNKLHRSMDRGLNWEAVSADLTRGGKEGNVPFGTLTSISESPLEFGRFIVGSDDGKVHVKTEKSEWIDVSDKIGKGLTEELWITRVIASVHEEERLYLSANGYRKDNMGQHLYVSNDFGSSWNYLGADLPSEPINVVLEDPADEDILYVGTDHGLYVSLDRGESFQALMNGLPHAPVHDIVLQERENELVVGTHGRSIYVADIDKLRQLDDIASGPYLFAIDSLNGSDRWGKAGWSKWFGVNEPELHIYFHESSDSQCQVNILSNRGTVLNTLEPQANNGLQSFTYDLTIDEKSLENYKKDLKKLKEQLQEAGENGKYYLKKGTYKVELNCGGKSDKKELIIN
ncbi:MAG: glycosyl hydrolase [Flavobacteriales bacterium]|nr:glycosyl hydrolase [Flavobacteriales bacterium]